MDDVKGQKEVVITEGPQGRVVVLLTHSQMLHVCYIYLHKWVIFLVNVGKYSRTMEHLGFVLGRTFSGITRYDTANCKPQKSTIHRR